MPLTCRCPAVCLLGWDGWIIGWDEWGALGLGEPEGGGMDDGMDGMEWMRWDRPDG